MSVREFNGLSLQFNAAIMSLAHTLIPMGWTPKEGAGEYTIRQMTDLYRRNRGHIYVNPEVPPYNPFDDDEYQYAFYAICQYYYIQQGYIAEHYLDYLALVDRINKALCKKYGLSEDTLLWSKWIKAILCGSYMYADKYGHYPVKMRDFVQAAAEYPETVLATEW